VVSHELRQRTTDLTESLEQQTATSEGALDPSEQRDVCGDLGAGLARQNACPAPTNLGSIEIRA
jgi:hypothetical protein